VKISWSIFRGCSTPGVMKKFFIFEILRIYQIYWFAIQSYSINWSILHSTSGWCLRTASIAWNLPLQADILFFTLVHSSLLRCLCRHVLITISSFIWSILASIISLLIASMHHSSTSSAGIYSRETSSLNLITFPEAERLKTFFTEFPIKTDLDNII